MSDNMSLFDIADIIAAKHDMNMKDLRATIISYNIYNSIPSSYNILASGTPAPSLYNLAYKADYYRISLN